MLSPGASKRQKELARQERQREKSDKPEDASASAGEDPDIAGIIPGPQPLLEE